MLTQVGSRRDTVDWWKVHGQRQLRRWIQWPQHRRIAVVRSVAQFRSLTTV